MIQKQLTDRLALALLEGEIHSGEEVTVDVRDGELVLEKGPVAADGGRLRPLCRARLFVYCGRFPGRPGYPGTRGNAVGLPN